MSTTQSDVEVRLAKGTQGNPPAVLCTGQQPVCTDWMSKQAYHICCWVPGLTLINLRCLSHRTPHSSLLLVQNSHSTCTVQCGSAEQARSGRRGGDEHHRTTANYTHLYAAPSSSAATTASCKPQSACPCVCIAECVGNKPHHVDPTAAYLVGLRHKVCPVECHRHRALAQQLLQRLAISLAQQACRNGDLGKLPGMQTARRQHCIGKASSAPQSSPLPSSQHVVAACLAPCTTSRDPG